MQNITSAFINLSPILEAIKGHEEDLTPLSLQIGTYINEMRSISILFTIGFVQWKQNIRRNLFRDIPTTNDWQRNKSIFALVC